MSYKFTIHMAQQPLTLEVKTEKEVQKLFKCFRKKKIYTINGSHSDVLIDLSKAHLLVFEKNQPSLEAEKE